MSRVFVHDGQTTHEEHLDAFCASPTTPYFVWLHIDGRKEDARHIAGRLSDMPEPAISALVAQETRPRCTFMGPGALINLRGPGVEAEGDFGDALVSIRIWAQKGRVISVSYRTLAALEPIMARMMNGTIHDPGDLIACLAQEITDVLDPEVAELGDTLDDIESEISEEGPTESRRRVSAIRATAIAYRRFIAPQRQAIERLAMAEAPWLEDDDRLHLQEAADRCARMAEELEAVRERSALAHEGLTDLRAEQMNLQALIISIVALVFLPLTFITGLLGMNVDGIPYAHEPWAFWGVVGVCAALAGAITAWFIASHWLKR
ncbi:zinc transporter ZntB [Sphingobium phenoxybenzoativorans]|uniref:Zinc transporter ZntB n=1 Tax=Sphingobium phenoxybenzoativorans TaxID=1592790 RepID=A0A975Q0W6_9SPHN|nr:zinc transporter ZntB [Sphingobium phenoxybenzoativorans]QUT04798.1 zinc transporter ZntB [Sphingobium phenoxybenzoativorans]